MTSAEWRIDTNLLDPDLFPNVKGPLHGLFHAW